MNYFPMLLFLLTLLLVLGLWHFLYLSPVVGTIDLIVWIVCVGGIYDNYRMY